MTPEQQEQTVIEMTKHKNALLKQAERYSRERIAKLVGLHPQTVAKIANGRPGAASEDKRKKIMKQERMRLRIVEEADLFSTPKICEATGLSRQKIWRIQKREGLIDNGLARIARQKRPSDDDSGLFSVPEFAVIRWSKNPRPHTGYY